MRAARGPAPAADRFAAKARLPRPRSQELSSSARAAAHGDGRGRRSLAVAPFQEGERLVGLAGGGAGICLGLREIGGVGEIVYQAGAACRIVGSLRDITDRMEAQARLVESEARARAVIETAFDAIVTVDEAGRIVEFNAAASRIFGHSREQVIGREVSETIIPEHRRQEHQAGMGHYLATGEKRILGRMAEMEGLRSDGSLIPIELSVTEVPLAKGRLFTAILRDLTERKGFQRQLGEAERKRANLARYFSPNMVDELMQSGGDLERARTRS